MFTRLACSSEHQWSAGTAGVICSGFAQRLAVGDGVVRAAEGDGCGRRHA